MNKTRGEVAIEIDGELYRLCLTLGALAELEAAFACESLADLHVRLRRLSASEMRQVVGILLCDTDAHDIVDGVMPSEAARAIGEAFHAALG